MNYNDLTATSLEYWLVRISYPQMAFLQVSDLLYFAQIDR